MKKFSNSRRSLLFLWFVMTFLSMVIQLNNATTSAAATVPNKDYSDALKSAPKGLSWDNNAFVTADFSKAIAYRKKAITSTEKGGFYGVLPSLGTHKSSLINNAEIVKSENQKEDNLPDNEKTSIIKMTNADWQTGAVWSNRNAQNYFEINHEQKASMWLYFGQIGDKLPGDGMAFVIQNDPNGENAIALSADGIPANGQSLGVWGPDWNYNNTLASKLSNSAIQNSWALEFDTFVNRQPSDAQILTGNGVGFDSAGRFTWSGNQHIAGNFPALATTYKSAGSNPNYVIMNHGTNVKVNTYQGSVTNQTMNLVDSKWHHVTITWEPTDDTAKEGTLTYAYNDKDPKSGKPQPDKTVTTSFKIDTDNFFKSDGTTTPDKNDKKLYWGFTGSTGDNSENNLMIFESLPSFVDAEATPAIYDDTQDGREIKNGDTVDPNDDIRYDYSLTYKGWAKEWDHINAYMEVPNHVTFNSATISYPGLAGDESFKVVQELDDNNKPVIHLQLPKKLNADQRYAKIELKGNTEPTASTQLTVPSAHASFEGDNLITTADTDSYYINARALKLTSTSENPIILKGENDLDVPGQVKYVNPPTYPDYQSMLVYRTLNGKTTTLNGAVDQNGKINLHIKYSELISGDNTLTFHVESVDHQLISNSVTRKIQTNTGSLSLTVPNTVEFKPINGSYKNQVIPRLNNWQIDVTDSRKAGGYWSVQAEASDLTRNSDGTKFKGNLFYRDVTGKDQDLNKAVTIATSLAKNSNKSEPINITDPWTSTDGILLNMQKGNIAGIYQGTIAWTLIDSLPKS